MTPDVDSNKPVLYKGQRYQIFQSEIFDRWLTELRDRQARIRILVRLRRLADGNPGDVKSVGDGIFELRLFFGPGYRAYFMYRGDIVVLLLAGGDKDSQKQDIATAKQLAELERDAPQDNNF